MMRTLGMLLLMLTAAMAWSAELTLERVEGEVSIRPGVDERWIPVGSGLVLKPHDSMKTGPEGSAVVLVLTDGTTLKEIMIPHNVILDLSDVRQLSRDELILKLTMERVKASPYEWKNGDLNIPNATVVHGEKPASVEVGESDLADAKLRMNGTKVLFDHGFFSTCALKALSLLGRFPSLGETFDHRLMVAESLERSDLRGEALSEYVALSSMTNLTEEQQSVVSQRIARLKREG